MSKIAAAAAGSAFGAFLRMARAERAITLGRKVQPECRKQANCACTNLTSNLHFEGVLENSKNLLPAAGMAIVPCEWHRLEENVSIKTKHAQKRGKAPERMSGDSMRVRFHFRRGRHGLLYRAGRQNH